MIRALAAKEYCSCINVVGRHEDECKDDLRVSLPVLPSLREAGEQRVTCLMQNREALTLDAGFCETGAGVPAAFRLLGRVEPVGLARPAPLAIDGSAYQGPGTKQPQS